jgi:fructokinase
VRLFAALVDWGGRLSLFGAVEAGGTKFVCAVGTDGGELLSRIEIPTSSPGETVSRVLDFFKSQAKHGLLAAIGIGSFGPIDVRTDSPTFGFITSTPKAGWQNTDLAGPIRGALKVPVAFDTDVNAAALGEKRWGTAQGLDTFVYVTVGTGIGGGAMVEGKLVHGLLHPEMGHMRITHDRQADPFAGVCPYHGDCWEGLATGPAIEARWGKKGQDLPADHKAWPLEAEYLALGVTSLICALSPQRIIMGGGVMRQQSLFPLVRRRTLETLNGYIQRKEILEHIDEYIVPPQLGESSGILGAIALAMEASIAG